MGQVVLIPVVFQNDSFLLKLMTVHAQFNLIFTR